jgi:hypothetical protein
MVRTESELAGLFEAYGYGSGQRPAGVQARLLLELLDIYHRAGLLPDGKNKPLCRICPNKRLCWDGGTEYLRKSPPVGNGGICLPWVGRDYRPGRDVVIVAINPNISPSYPSDLLIEHGITWEHHIVGLALNARSHEHSRFAYGSMRGAAALLDVADGALARDREPHELAGLVRRVARLQAIKCIPTTPTSEPLPNMWLHCPDFLLASELDVLHPQFVIALGEHPRWALSRLEGYRSKRCGAARLHRGEIRRDGWHATVYGLDHPRVGNASDESLIRTLRRTH